MTFRNGASPGVRCADKSVCSDAHPASRGLSIRPPGLLGAGRISKSGQTMQPTAGIPVSRLSDTDIPVCADHAESLDLMGGTPDLSTQVIEVISQHQEKPSWSSALPVFALRATTRQLPSGSPKAWRRRPGTPSSNSAQSSRLDFDYLVATSANESKCISRLAGALRYQNRVCLHEGTYVERFGETPLPLGKQVKLGASRVRSGSGRNLQNLIDSDLWLWREKECYTPANVFFATRSSSTQPR
jgi:hypothetical protein